MSVEKIHSTDQYEHTTVYSNKKQSDGCETIKYVFPKKTDKNAYFETHTGT